MLYRLYIIYNTRVFANACIFHTIFRSSIILAINRNLEPLSNHWRPPRNQEIYHTYINTHTSHTRKHTHRISSGWWIRYISHCLDRRPLLPINNTDLINIFKRLHRSCLYIYIRRSMFLVLKIDKSIQDDHCLTCTFVLHISNTRFSNRC